MKSHVASSRIKATAMPHSPSLRWRTGVHTRAQVEDTKCNRATVVDE
jgi:hypothetical protein